MTFEVGRIPVYVHLQFDDPGYQQDISEYSYIESPAAVETFFIFVRLGKMGKIPSLQRVAVFWGKQATMLSCRNFDFKAMLDKTTYQNAPQQIKDSLHFDELRDLSFLCMGTHNAEKCRSCPCQDCFNQGCFSQEPCPIPDPTTTIPEGPTNATPDRNDAGGTS